MIYCTTGWAAKLLDLWFEIKSAWSLVGVEDFWYRGGCPRELLLFLLVRDRQGRSVLAKCHPDVGSVIEVNGMWFQSGFLGKTWSREWGGQTQSSGIYQSTGKCRLRSRTSALPGHFEQLTWPLSVEHGRLTSLREVTRGCGNCWPRAGAWLP